jgi:hypothetical protein
VSPFSGGVYLGTATVETSGGSQSVLVGLTFYDDVSLDIEDAENDLEDALLLMTAGQKSALSTDIDDVSSLLDSARTDMDFGDYKSAERNLREAEAKIDLLSGIASSGVTPSTPTTPTTPTPTTPADSSSVFLIIIVVIIAAMGVLVWYYLTKVRKKKGVEEELEEEF